MSIIKKIEKLLNGSRSKLDDAGQLVHIHGMVGGLLVYLQNGKTTEVKYVAPVYGKSLGRWAFCSPAESLWYPPHAIEEALADVEAFALADEDVRDFMDYENRCAGCN